MFGTPINLAVLENLFCESIREKEVVDIITPGQSFFVGVQQGNSFSKQQHRVVVSSGLRLVVSSTPYAGVPVTSNETYPMLGDSNIAIKAEHNGNWKSCFFKTETLGGREMISIKTLFFNPQRPGETLPGYHTRVANLVVEQRVVKQLLLGQTPSRNQKEYRRGTERMPWNTTPRPYLLQALARHQPQARAIPAQAAVAVGETDSPPIQPPAPTRTQKRNGRLGPPVIAATAPATPPPAATPPPPATPPTPTPPAAPVVAPTAAPPATSPPPLLVWATQRTLD
jgi:hypothetical protein